jgi:alanine racemase
MRRQGGITRVAFPAAGFRATRVGTGDRRRRETCLEPPATAAHKGGSHLASNGRRTMDLRLLRDTRLEIDLDLLAHNVRTVRALLEEEHPPGERPRIAAVLKGDAYGFGAVHTAGVMLEEGVDVLAVACLPEALELRRRYPDGPIMIMGYTPDDLLTMAVENLITLTIFRASQARIISEATGGGAPPASVHIKVDTGMNRLGLDPDEKGVQEVRAMAGLPGVELEGIFTHLALVDRESDEEQFRRFIGFVGALEDAGITIPVKHVCDSIGMLRYPRFRLDMVRPGAILYGAPPLRTPYSDTLDIRIPFALKARISRLRALGPQEGVGYDFSWRAPETGALLATVPVGFGDGYRRCLSNRAHVVVRGVKAPVVGLVSMDQCTVDVTGVPGVQEGDDVLLLGQDPEGAVPILEMATWAGTNRNEILAGIGRRVPRVYTRSGQACSMVDYLA